MAIREEMIFLWSFWRLDFHPAQVQLALAFGRNV